MKILRSRRSIRLPGYDYTQPGGYYITIVTYDRENLFGDIRDGEMVYNEFGEILRDEWQKTASLRPYVELDAFCVMPNHFHGIIMINDDYCRGTARRAPTEIITPTETYAPTEQFGKPINYSIPTIVRAYKSAVTKRINELRNTPAAPVWQRNYYEHIIRNDIELTHIRNYIQNNPNHWETDTERIGRGL